MTAVEWLHQFDPDASRQDIHGLLGQMLFSGEEGLKPTEALSGGETARLLFCRIMLQKPNVLILDEPTNHLDLESINALNIALQKFEGTILLVTHDQDLLEEVGTRVWQFENGRIVDFKGTYEELTGTGTTASERRVSADVACVRRRRARRLVAISHFENRVLLHHEILGQRRRQLVHLARPVVASTTLPERPRAAAA